jgi:hypothetical protein
MRIAFDSLGIIFVLPPRPFCSRRRSLARYRPKDQSIYRNNGHLLWRVAAFVIWMELFFLLLADIQCIPRVYRRTDQRDVLLAVSCVLRGIIAFRYRGSRHFRRSPPTRCTSSSSKSNAPPCRPPSSCSRHGFRLTWTIGSKIKQAGRMVIPACHGGQKRFRFVATARSTILS